VRKGKKGNPRRGKEKEERLARMERKKEGEPILLPEEDGLSWAG